MLVSRVRGSNDGLGRSDSQGLSANRFDNLPNFVVTESMARLNCWTKEYIYVLGEQACGRVVLEPLIEDRAVHTKWRSFRVLNKLGAYNDVCVRGEGDRHEPVFSSRVRGSTTVSSTTHFSISSSDIPAIVSAAAFRAFPASVMLGVDRLVYFRQGCFDYLTDGFAFAVARIRNC